MASAEETYTCTQCGSDETEIVRKDPTNPRCKCTSCHFMFNGQDSIAASAAGAIKPSSAETLATATEPEVRNLVVPDVKSGLSTGSTDSVPLGVNADIPRTPSHVFISRKSGLVEFCTKRDFKKTAIKWSQGPAFDVYELNGVKLQVDVSFKQT